MSRAIVAVLALLLLAPVGVYGLDLALENAGERHDVTNESWTVNISNITILDNSNIAGAYYDNEVTVYNNSNDTQIEGTDYEWFETNGTVKALSGGNLTDGNGANITYGWDEPTTQQSQLTTAAGQIPRFIGIIAPVFVLILFLILLSG